MDMNLKKGGTYFIVTFEDKDLKVPIIQTLEFVSEEVGSSGTSVALFRQCGINENEKMFFVRDCDLESLLVDQKGLLAMLEKSFSGRLHIEGM
ncbi:hypothetical protein [Pseudoxanthomonas winnipegensis]|uniref:Uncharacterized protein n=1 Tax=Pseudoxanthomonas winnipegensis TaxID=2480810 RepID=A0A4Q8LSK3_9GAMM|nr:hypothetical protein [Pseudoxanthomonas winnipegensis]RZZ88373.1 hypothetical protein EA663_05970 [Pseudoxanthomonas winnipegensis]TAA34660.1 hypothetical protein EA656_13220 [Pseudoxanthomonas winnipegensis]